VHIHILVSPTVDDTTGRFPSCTPAAVVLTMIWVVTSTFAPSVTTLTVTDVVVADALQKENRSIWNMNLHQGMARTVFNCTKYTVAT